MHAVEGYMEFAPGQSIGRKINLTSKLFHDAERAVHILDGQASAISNMRNPRGDNTPGRTAQIIEDLMKIVLNDPLFRFKPEEKEPELWSPEWWAKNGPIWRERLKQENAGTTEKGHSKDAI